MKAYGFTDPRSRPIRGVLFAATAFTAVCFAPAYGADATISASINQSTGVNLNGLLPGGGTVDILAGVTIMPGFFSQATAGIAYAVSNAGTLNNPAGNAPGVLLSGGTITNLQGGTITNSNGADGRAIRILGGTGNISLVNSGTIRGEIELSAIVDLGNLNPAIGTPQAISLTNNATGVIEGEIDFSGGTSNTLTNFGRITGSILLAQETPDPDPPLPTNTIVIAPVKTFTNGSTGIVTGDVLIGGGYVRNLPFNGIITSYDVFTQGTLSNAGTINGLVAADSIINTGTITVAPGAVAVVSYGNSSPTTNASLSGSLNNSGTITGDVSIRAITNTGTINGNLLFGTDPGKLLNVDEVHQPILGGIASQRAVVSTMLVNSGTINGRITMANGAVTNSGKLGLGTAIAESTIGGNFTHTSTGTLVIKVNDAGQGDKLTVSGQAFLQGGTLSIAAANGSWNVNRTYSILSATGGVSGTFANLDITLPYLKPSLTYSANAVTLTVDRQTADIQEDVIAETTAQQVSTSARRVSAAIDARVDQAVSAAFISMPGLDQTAFLPGNVSGISAGDAGTTQWGTWATFTPTFLKQSIVLPGSATAQKIDGTSLSFLAGVDRTLGARIIAGTFFSYESSDYDVVSTAGERKGKGPLVGAYVGALLSDWAYASIQVNHAWLSNRVAEGTFGAVPVTGKFDSRRVMFSSTLTARKPMEMAILSSKIGYSYTRENFKSYTASDAAVVTPGATRLGRVSLGGEASGAGKTFVPYASATYEWDVDTTGVGDKNGAVFGAGLRYIRGMLSFDLYGSAQAFRMQERSYSLGVNARYAF